MALISSSPTRMELLGTWVPASPFSLCVRRRVEIHVTKLTRLLLVALTLQLCVAVLRAEDEEAPAKARLHEVVHVGSNAMVGPNESVSVVTVMNGDAQVEGEVRGAVFVLNGNLKVSGVIRGDVVVIGGDLEALPTAVLRREATVIGGKILQSPGAHLRGDNHVFSPETSPVLQGLMDWVLQGALWLRPLPPRVLWIWVFPIASLLLYFLMGLILPSPTRACVSALVDRPIISYLVGLFVLCFLLVLTPVLVLLGAVGIGFILIFALGLGLCFGRMVVVQFVGLQVTREVGWSVLHRPSVGLLVGSLILCLLYMVPILGVMLWFGILPMALGSLLIATARTLRPKRTAQNSRIPSGTAETPSMAMNTPPPILEAKVPVGLFMRTVATFLDFIVVGLLGHLFGLEGRLWLMLWMSYHVALWTWNGATLGGMVIGCCLREADGSAIPFKTAVTRCLAAFLSALPLGFGFVWAAWDLRKQSWHDKLTGTYMVWKK